MGQASPPTFDGKTLREFMDELTQVLSDAFGFVAATLQPLQPKLEAVRIDNADHIRSVIMQAATSPTSTRTTKRSKAQQVERRPVPSVPGLEVDSLGRVYDAETGKQLHQSTRGGSNTWTRYKSINLYVEGPNGKNVTRPLYVHHLVAEAFLGPKPFEGAIVMHRDDNRAHNTPENLAYGTIKDNVRDALYFNRYPRGSRCKHAKLTETDVWEIFALTAQGDPREALAEAYGVSRTTISQVLRRRTWKHVEIADEILDAIAAQTRVR